MGELTDSIGSGVAFEETESLVVRLKQGDEAAFAEAFDLYKDLVYTLAFKLLADKGEAMDVTQDVFLTLFRKIHSFRGECALKTWLYRVTLNQAANRNRWWKRRFRHKTIALSLEPSGDGTPLQEPRSLEPGPDRHLLSRELDEALRRGLKALPFDQRAAVVLRDVEGLSYEEIAEIMGAQLGTVKSRISRGREHLRSLLAPFQKGVSR